VLSFENYLKEELKQIEEGVNDPAIFKAVFLAGGPGSGKSFIVGKTGLPALGFKVVNSDDAFESAMKKAGMEMDPDNIFSVKGQELRGKAKKLTANKQAMYVKGRLGLCIDGTGKDTSKLMSQAKELKKLGYDVAMIFVNTDLDTAQARNKARARTLPADEVQKYWTTVQKNIGSFQTMFGKQKFTVVDNSEGKDYQKETTRAYREITKFVNAEPDNAIAKRWIKSEKTKKTR
jgi:shikimate kinase|tara:strand:+ start:320 stop:1018 length:699 start_codon:yes stop_codon:yes gene_type:complete